MKNNIPKYFLKPLLVLVPLDILLIILRWFMPLNFAINSPSMTMRILGVLIIIALFPINFVVVLAIGGIFFESSEEKQHKRQLADGTIINLEGIGEFFYRDWLPNGYCKTETLALLGKEYKVHILMESNSKATPITDAQIQAYYAFMENYPKSQAELEGVLHTQEYDEIFEPSEIIIDSNGDYKMVASDTTSDDSDGEFVVTFNPIEIIPQQIDYEGE